MNFNEINVKVENCIYIEEKDEWVLKPRKNPYHKLLISLGSSGAFRLGDTQYPCEKGLLMYTCPGQEHAIESFDGTFPNYIAIHFWVFGITYTNEPSLEFTERKVPLPIDAMLQIKNVEGVISIFEHIRGVWKNMAYGYMLDSTSRFGFLIGQLIRETQRDKDVDRQINRIEKVISHIYNNAHKKMRVEELAALAELSRSHFQRTFKTFTGVSVSSYIVELRMNEAKSLLTTSDLTVKEISRQVGYGDEFYFSRIFRKSVGISPSQYRVLY